MDDSSFFEEVSAEESSDRRANFTRLAEKRTLAVMDKVRILSNLANRNLYEYSEHDVRQIFDAIDEELKAARTRFESTRKRKLEFRLRSEKAVVDQRQAPDQVDQPSQ